MAGSPKLKRIKNDMLVTFACLTNQINRGQGAVEEAVSQFQFNCTAQPERINKSPRGDGTSIVARPAPIFPTFSRQQ